MLRYPILFKFFLGFIVKLLFVSFFPECDDSFLKFVFSRWANVSRPRYLWRQQLIQRIATTNCVSFWKAWTLSILSCRRLPPARTLACRGKTFIEWLFFCARSMKHFHLLFYTSRNCLNHWPIRRGLSISRRDKPNPWRTRGMPR